MRLLLRNSRKSSISCVRSNETSVFKPIAKRFPQSPTLARRCSRVPRSLLAGFTGSVKQPQCR
jgi:hypothetical protein